MELEKALAMRKQELHLRGLKIILSKRKEGDGVNSYQKTLNKVEKLAKELKQQKE